MEIKKSLDEQVGSFERERGKERRRRRVSVCMMTSDDRLGSTTASSSSWSNHPMDSPQWPNTLVAAYFAAPTSPQDQPRNKREREERKGERERGFCHLAIL
jgi:hypothetical protein